jgi:hypothetical protein
MGSGRPARGRAMADCTPELSARIRRAFLGDNPSRGDVSEAIKHYSSDRDSSWPSRTEKPYQPARFVASFGPQGGWETPSRSRP